jgi:hypothetical protein
MILCEYKDVFGKPEEGVHSLRMLNIAIVDLALTIMFAYWFARRYNYEFKYTFGAIFILGIIAHRLFCVNTTVNTIIFGVI